MAGLESARMLPDNRIEFADPAPGFAATLAARQARYGNFAGQARITQNLRAAMADSENWHSLSADKRHALEMITVKIARILNGDAAHRDSWHDIGGYAQLVADTLRDS